MNKRLIAFLSILSLSLSLPFTPANGANPVYLYKDLIAEAEKYVVDNPYVEPKTASTGFNNKTTVTCVKGKTTKKVTGLTPKCPKGFKKK